MKPLKHFTPYPEPKNGNMTEWLRWFYYHYNVPKSTGGQKLRNNREQPLNYAGQEQLELDHEEWRTANQLPEFE